MDARSMECKASGLQFEIEQLRLKHARRSDAVSCRRKPAQL
jgi:hypothetical protein